MTRLQFAGLPTGSCWGSGPGGTSISPHGFTAGSWLPAPRCSLGTVP